MSPVLYATFAHTSSSFTQNLDMFPRVRSMISTVRWAGSLG